MDKKSRQKNALLISFAFPPLGGSGVQRVLKFAKYLPQFGWKPVILTVKSAVFHAYDQENLKETENLKIYRTRFIDFLNIKNRIITPLPDPPPQVGRENNQGKTPQVKRENEKSKKRFILIKPLMKFFNQYFLIPDDKIGWIPFAVTEALKIIKKEKIDVIYTTGDPFSTFLIGLIIKKLTNKPWVIDYRDSWTDFSLTNPIYFKGKYRQNLENIMEYHVLKNADKIISVSPAINEKLQKKHRKINEEKYAVIHNGYDPDDFKNIRKINNEKFIITHAGIFNTTRTPALFLQALHELFKENDGLKEKIEARLIGLSLNENINEIINRYNLNQNVKTIGYLKHNECVKEIINSDALLLIQDYNNLEAYSGKIFEYLYTKNPIIALVPSDGCAADLIRKTNSGIIVKENNTPFIKEAIKEIYLNNNNKPDMKIIETFNRKNLTEKLANIFDNA